MSASPNLQLPYLDANQNQKSVTHNAALRRLDALVHVAVLSSALQAPPAAPADGQRWIVAPGGAGAWAGRDLAIAAWQDGAWSFYPPGPGTLAFDAAQGAVVCWSGTAWRALAGDPLASAGLPPALDYRLTEPDCLPPGQFARLSAGTVTGAAGLLVPVAAGALRIDHDPLTGVPLGALIEEQRTNLLLASEAFDDPAWAKLSSITIAPDAALAPDGRSTADKMVEGAVAAQHRVQQPVSVAPGAAVVHSVFARAGERTQFDLLDTGSTVAGAGFDLAAGTVVINQSYVAQLSVADGTAGIVPFPNGWYRCWIRVSAAGSSSTPTMLIRNASGSINYAGDGASGLYVWGAMTEVGAFVTSYVPTTSAQATRAADSLVVPATTGWFNPNEGTIFVEAAAPPVVPGGTFPTLFQIDDGTFVNRYVCYIAGTAVYFAVFQGGAFAGAQLVASVQLGQPLRVAVSYGAAGKVMAVLGTLSGSSAMTLLEGLTQLSLGTSNSGAGGLGAQIRRAAYLPRALTAAQLQAMTA